MKRALIVAVFLCVLTVLAGIPLSSEPPGNGSHARPDTNRVLPHLSVRLFDYAQRSAHERGEVERAASQLVRGAGVEIDWTDCGLARADAVVCGRASSSTDITVRLLNEPSDPGSRGEVVGRAVGTYVDVFYTTALHMATGGVSGTMQVLGAAIAHELGHILLGGRAHCPHGIMRASWTVVDLRLISEGNLRFDAAQSLRILRTVASWTQARDAVAGARREDRENENSTVPGAQSAADGSRELAAKER